MEGVEEWVGGYARNVRKPKNDGEGRKERRKEVGKEGRKEGRAIVLLPLVA